MAAEACGGQSEAAVPAACAVEMVHAYSLIHDDLTAMDDELGRDCPMSRRSSIGRLPVGIVPAGHTTRAILAADQSRSAGTQVPPKRL